MNLFPHPVLVNGSTEMQTELVYPPTVVEPNGNVSGSCGLKEPPFLKSEIGECEMD